MNLRTLVGDIDRRLVEKSAWEMRGGKERKNKSKKEEGKEGKEGNSVE